MKLKQLLSVIDPLQRVDVQVFAYGVFCTSSRADELITAEDVLAQARKCVLDAKVTFVLIVREEEDHIDFDVLHIQVELCK